MLTEEEKEYVEELIYTREGVDRTSDRLLTFITRLLAENEELRRGRNVTLRTVGDLQSQLDAIKKAAEMVESERVDGTEREERYRQALEEIRDSVLHLASDMKKIARRALSSSPAPEPVTVEMEELAQEIAFSYEGCSILKGDFMRLKRALDRLIGGREVSDTWSSEHLKRAKGGIGYYTEKAILDSQEIEVLKSQLALSTKREEIYRKALEEIEKGIVMYDSFLWARDIARTALNEGKEVK